MSSLLHIALTIALAAAPSAPAGAADYLKGAIFRLYYAPFGAADLTVPYDYPNTEEHRRYLDSHRGDGHGRLTTLTGFQAALGYHRGIFQGEAALARSETAHLEIRDDDGIGSERLGGHASKYDLRLGLRFGDPGDTSYLWLFTGLRRCAIESDYLDSSAAGTGICAGIKGFLGTGLHGSYELVLTYELFFGPYRWQEYSSDYSLDIDRDTGIMAGASLGIGAQHEPLGISVIVKAAPEINLFRYYEGGDRAHVALTEALLGIEIMYLVRHIEHNTAGEGR